MGGPHILRGVLCLGIVCGDNEYPDGLKIKDNICDRFVELLI